MGLQDSYNLAWKMALVLHGIAPESLMETYEVERKVIHATVTLGAVAVHDDPNLTLIYCFSLWRIASSN